MGEPSSSSGRSGGSGLGSVRTCNSSLAISSGGSGMAIGRGSRVLCGSDRISCLTASSDCFSGRSISGQKPISVF